MSDDDFGFTSTPQDIEELRRADQAARVLGYASREATDPPPPVQRKTLGPVEIVTIRAPITVSRTFKRWCEENRYSYWEGIEALMQRAGVR
ncbi:MAG: hypothetical protein ACJ8AW_24355 [Rhodopila sp.]